MNRTEYRRHVKAAALDPTVDDTEFFHLVSDWGMRVTAQDARTVAADLLTGLRRLLPIVGKRG